MYEKWEKIQTIIINIKYYYRRYCDMENNEVLVYFDYELDMDYDYQPEHTYQ